MAGGIYTIRQKTYKTNVNILRRYLFGGVKWRVAATLQDKNYTRQLLLPQKDILLEVAGGRWHQLYKATSLQGNYYFVRKTFFERWRVAGGRYSVRQKTYKTNDNILRRYVFGGGRWRVAATLEDKNPTRQLLLLSQKDILLEVAGGRCSTREELFLTKAYD